jgi:hypothetical protein
MRVNSCCSSQNDCLQITKWIILAHVGTGNGRNNRSVANASRQSKNTKETLEIYAINLRVHSERAVSRASDVWWMP